MPKFHIRCLNPNQCKLHYILNLKHLLRKLYDVTVVIESFERRTIRVACATQGIVGEQWRANRAIRRLIAYSSTPPTPPPVEPPSRLMSS